MTTNRLTVFSLHQLEVLWLVHNYDVAKLHFTDSPNSNITTQFGNLENIYSHHNLKTAHFGLSLF